MRGRRLLFVGALIAAFGTICGYVSFEALESENCTLWGSIFSRGPSDRAVVALTYDDGPNPPYTDRILDVLKQEGVHATFFVVGRAARDHPREILRMVREGHAIGNHTWDHAHLIMLSPEAIRQELQRTEETIGRIAHIRPHLMRPPFGQRDFSVMEEARRGGYTVVMWSVPLPHDWDQPGASVIAGRVLDRVTNGSIIVLHDGDRGASGDREQEIEATREIIQGVRARGYAFVTIPVLMRIAAH